MFRDTRRINIETNFYDDDEYNQIKTHEETFETNLLNRDRGAIALYNILDTFRLHRIVNAFNMLHLAEQAGGRVRDVLDGGGVGRSAHRFVGASQPSHNYRSRHEHLETEYLVPETNSTRSNKKRSQSLNNQSKTHSNFLRESRKRILQSITKSFQQKPQPFPNPNPNPIPSHLQSQPNHPNFNTHAPQKQKSMKNHQQNHQKSDNLQIRTRIQRLEKLMKNIRREKEKNQPVIVHQRRQVAEIPKQDKGNQQMRVFIQEIQSLRYQMKEIKVMNEEILQHSRQRSLRTSRTPSRSDSQVFPEPPPHLPTNINIKRSQFLQSQKPQQNHPTNISQKNYSHYHQPHINHNHNHSRNNQRINHRQHIKSENKESRRKDDRAPEKYLREGTGGTSHGNGGNRGNQRIKLKYQGEVMERYRDREDEDRRASRNNIYSNTHTYTYKTNPNNPSNPPQKQPQPVLTQIEPKPKKMPPKAKPQQIQQVLQFQIKNSAIGTDTKPHLDRQRQRQWERNRVNQQQQQQQQQQLYYDWTNGQSKYKGKYQVGENSGVDNWLSSLSSHQSKNVGSKPSNTGTRSIQNEYKTSAWYKQYGSPTYNFTNPQPKLPQPQLPPPISIPTNQSTLKPSQTRPRYNLQLLNLQQIKDTVSNSNANSSRTSNYNSMNSRSSSPQNVAGGGLGGLGLGGLGGLDGGGYDRYREYNAGGYEYGGYNVKNVGLAANSDYTNPNLLKQLNIGPFPKISSQKPPQPSSSHPKYHQAQPHRNSPPQPRLTSINTISDGGNQLSSYTYSKNSSSGTSMAKLQQQYENIINDSPFLNKGDHRNQYASYDGIVGEGSDGVDGADGTDGVNLRKIASLEDQVNRYFATVGHQVEYGDGGGGGTWGDTGRYQQMYDKYATHHY